MPQKQQTGTKPASSCCLLIPGDGEPPSPWTLTLTGLGTGSQKLGVAIPARPDHSGTVVLMTFTGVVWIWTPAVLLKTGFGALVSQLPVLNSQTLLPHSSSCPQRLAQGLVSSSAVCGKCILRGVHFPSPHGKRMPGSKRSWVLFTEGKVCSGDRERAWLPH